MPPESQARRRQDTAAGKRKRRLGEYLVHKGIISEDQLRIALTEQQRSQRQLGQILVQLGFLTESVLRDFLGEVLGQESIDLGRVVPDPAALELIPKDLARRYKLLPVNYDKETGELLVAMADTYDLLAQDKLLAHLGGRLIVKPVLAGGAEIETAIDQYYGHVLSLEGILQEIETGEIDYQSLTTESEEYSQPVVRLVNAIISDAVKRDASDIHFEPERGFLRVRYRIDGVLRQVRSLHRNYSPAIVVRLKVMAHMNIAETRAPQDGRFSLRVTGRDVDFRVSSQPTTHGENIVLRILDREKGIVPLEQLGLEPDNLDLLRLLMSRPEGIMMVTGPTGSGKTTTLYSMLSHVNHEGINIMTLEDPVEYPMSMIRQTSVNEAAKLDFANGIRSMMRQDPDVILVGEIRDEDTAQMAFRAAMTGHQVFSTLHTNSAIGAFPRLRDIGVIPDILAGNIIGVLAQRLVRKLCTHCREPYAPDGIELRILGLPPDEHPTLMRAKGCPRCDHTGYRGRVALMEILRMDPELDELVASNATQKTLLDAAFERGFRPLVEDGVRRVLSGVTSLDEVTRVVDLTGRL
ncbi:MAG: ATPase, T2SS/T4P/T4SS family [Gammaproteobacteria bacterium]|jgi:type IV pilus assembly protein PilB